jgi:hypothetical protein
MIDTNIVVTTHGPLFESSSLFPGKIQLITQAIAKLVEDTAKNDFIIKKKAEPKMPSLIFSSIDYNIKESNNSSTKAIVFAGGPSNNIPFYTKYVNDGHMLRNGIRWEGYDFMGVGTEEGNKQAMQITRKILNLK